MSIFSIILLSVISSLHLYVFGRAATIPLIREHLPLRYLFGLGILLWGLFFLSRTLRHGQPGQWAPILESVGMGWMGTLFLIFICLLTVDLLTLFGFLLPRLAPTLRELALFTGLMLSVVAVFQGVRPPVVKDYQVSLSDLPHRMTGKRIVAMTDMHLGTQLGRAWLAERINQVQALNPDMVVLVGDILDGHDGAMTQLIPEFRRLSAPLGVYAVLGNHEFYRGADLCTAVLKDAGISVLRNRWIEVHPGLIIGGIDDLTATRRSNIEEAAFSQTLANRPSGAAILLSHTPWQAQEAARSGIGLMLSGHTHNGQVWPFNFLVRRVYPLLYGAYPIDGMTTIVCRGTGTWGPRMRLWHPGEILNITITPMSSN